jgi:lipoprotein-anchoring transpeptidase ErfK/SrfK
MLRLLPVLLVIAVIAAFINFSPLKREIAYGLGISGDTTESCCDPNNLSKTGNFDETANIAIYNNKTIDYPKTSLAQVIKNPVLNDTRVLGTTNAAGEEKWIDVSLDEQKLRAYEGDQIIMEFPISSGKWAPTPKGEFRIWYKTRAQAMSGGSKDLGTYYYLPNVPHNMFFYQGYAIHGAYWHNNFGQPMSHGCVNSPLAQVAELFEWTGPVLPPGTNALRASVDNPGTRVYVH